jgi:hypothetical protein
MENALKGKILLVLVVTFVHLSAGSISGDPGYAPRPEHLSNANDGLDNSVGSTGRANTFIRLLKREQRMVEKVRLVRMMCNRLF